MSHVFVPKALSGIVRKVGQSLDSFGALLELNPNFDRLQPESSVVKYKTHVPELNDSFVARNASVIGNVKMGKRSFVWSGAIVRADVNGVKIGDNVSVKDLSMVHCRGNAATTIGNNVIIGAGAIVHGATLEDGVQIGDGAQVLDGAVVGRNSIISAGSILTSGKQVPANQVWSGVPAKYERQVSHEELVAAERLLAEDKQIADECELEYAKSVEEQQEDIDNQEQRYFRSPAYFKKATPEMLSKDFGEVDGHSFPGRILNSKLSARTKPWQGPKSEK